MEQFMNNICNTVYMMKTNFVSEKVRSKEILFHEKNFEFCYLKIL